MEQFLLTPQWALTKNQTHVETPFFFSHLVGLEGPPNHPVSKVKAFCVNIMTGTSQNQK